MVVRLGEHQPWRSRSGVAVDCLQHWGAPTVTTTPLW
jgi:hypothetical protein